MSLCGKRESKLEFWNLTKIIFESQVSLNHFVVFSLKILSRLSYDHSVRSVWAILNEIERNEYITIQFAKLMTWIFKYKLDYFMNLSYYFPTFSHVYGQFLYTSQFHSLLFIFRIFQCWIISSQLPKHF